MLAAGMGAAVWPCHARSSSALAVQSRAIVVRRWESGNARLAPLTAYGKEVLYAGDSHLGRIDPARPQAVWHIAHGLASEAVFRPRAAGPLVLCGGLGEIGAWTVVQGERRWRYAAHVQLGVPWITQQQTYVGDGHELLALDNASGQVRWRHAGTPDTITAYAPVLSGQTLMYAPGNGVLYGLDASSGQLKWRLDRSHEWQYLRQLHVSGEVLVAGSYKEKLYGISVSDGRVLWTFNAGNFINSHHVAGDAAYLWSPTGWVYAIDTRSGKVHWRHRTTDYRSDGTGWGPLMAELVTRDGHLYALDMTQVLHVLDRKTGEEVRRILMPQPLRPTLLPLAERQGLVATGEGEVLLVRW
jgi:outer membrane protein assembly factor BamB